MVISLAGGYYGNLGAVTPINQPTNARDEATLMVVVMV